MTDPLDGSSMTIINASDIPFSHPSRRIPPNDLAEALDSLGDIAAFSSRDWSHHREDAWIYGLVAGWDCEDDHGHGEDCSDLEDLAGYYAWSGEQVARLRRLRAAVKEAQSR